MKRIEFNHKVDGPVPFPYYSKDGEVQKDLLSFLLCRYYSYSRFNCLKLTKPLRSVTPTSIKQLAHRVAFLLNRLEENENDKGKQEPIHYLEANFQDIEKLVEHLYEKENWKGSSLVSYASSWRLFYEFLTLENIHHNMFFPDKIPDTYKTDKDSQFLSHTSKSSTFEDTLIESAVPSKYRSPEFDYKDSIISLKDYFKLYEALFEDDTVYGVMAGTMMQTFLRISGILQFPLAPDRKNPKWKRYIELKRDNEDFQYFNYISKGQKAKSCLVHFSTMEMLNTLYLDKVYDERLELYKENYVQSKHAKKQNRSADMRFTWLNKNGTPVSRRALQSAFERASDKIGINVHPHTIRHTGATQLLFAWSKKQEIEITEANASDIHMWLKSSHCFLFSKLD